MDPMVALDGLSQVISDRSSDVARMEDYYRGKQPLKFATDSWRKFHQERFEGFADNWCRVVADSAAERLLLTGLRLPDAPEQGDDTDAKELWRVWETSDGDAISSQGFVSSLIARRSFTMVWGDPARITWEHASEVAVAYDPETRRRTAAVKMWRDGDMDHATVFLPDGIYKYSRNRAVKEERSKVGIIVPGSHDRRGEWGPREVDGEAWPIPNPFGEVPIVEWPNRPMLAGEPMSEIGGVAQMQDAINLMWAYLFTSADHASWPQRVLMGAEPPTVPILDASTGEVVGHKPVDMKKLAQDRFLVLSGQNAKIGQFDPAKLDVFTGVIEQAVQHLAAQTRTPPHYLMGKMVNANAEALKVAETGLVKKVEEAQTFFGPAARDTFRLVAKAMDRGRLADRVAAGKVQWRNPENRSESQLSDAMQKRKDIGFPFRSILEEYGYSDMEADRIMDQRRREMSDTVFADIEAAIGAAG